ncbi:MAG: sulfite exporter TauE/SafE family protein [Smithellaceae bacterium]|jgi:sulfite exporter TauE/SafE|nr:sulfite exporter TauE/SafE family protein [Smithellaceae bacterium]
MTQELGILITAAVTIGFFHTLFGPDHYVPFIVMSKARKWSFFKTTGITFLCGLGHVGSSVILGFIGIGFGLSITSLAPLESIRGSIAGWALIAFGFVYFIWGIRKAYRNKPHTHWHPHSDGKVHKHEHVHAEEHVHVHEEDGTRSITPWILFAIFVFGPCEPLIPILMYPAAQGHFFHVILVSVIFSAVTISAMLTIVLASVAGIKLLPFGRLERYTHALAGTAVLLCGVAIQFLGL